MKETFMNHEQKKIAEWMTKVRFRKKILGGVDEQDVWQKIEELNRMYEAALSAERARYDALLHEQRRTSSKALKSLEPSTKRKGIQDGKEER